jgi:RNA polymerase sigma factor (sigma-70 family)
MITRETIEDRHEEVTTLIKWWVIQEKFRYHKIRRRGWSMDDFTHDVWVRLLKQFTDGFCVDCSLSTVVTNMCFWELSHYHRNQTVFDFRLFLYCKQPTNSNIYHDTLAEDRDEAKVFDLALAIVLRHLSDREIRIVRSRYGLFGDNTLTLDEVGDVLKICRERVRQIEVKALKKLQHHSLASALEPFYPLVPNPQEFYQCEIE